MKNKATVLLLHGSKDPSWMAPFLDLRQKISAKSPGARIDIACLQFGSPTLEETVSKLAAEGFGNIVVVPVFISTLGHVAKDVPALLERTQKAFPGIKITTTPAVGEIPSIKKALIEGIATIALE